MCDRGHLKPARELNTAGLRAHRAICHWQVNFPQFWQMKMQQFWREFFPPGRVPGCWIRQGFEQPARTEAVLVVVTDHDPPFLRSQFGSDSRLPTTRFVRKCLAARSAANELVNRVVSRSVRQPARILIHQQVEGSSPSRIATENRSKTACCEYLPSDDMTPPLPHGEPLANNSGQPSVSDWRPAAPATTAVARIQASIRSSRAAVPERGSTWPDQSRDTPSCRLQRHRDRGACTARPNSCRIRPRPGEPRNSGAVHAMTRRNSGNFFSFANRRHRSIRDS